MTGASIVLGGLLIAVVMGLTAGSGRRPPLTVTGTPPATSATRLEQQFLAPLESGKPTDFHGTDVVAISVSNLELKEVAASPYETFKTIFSTQTVTPAQVLEPFPPHLVTVNVYVEIAIGRFEILNDHRRGTCLIVIRSNNSPYQPIAASISNDTTIPSWIDTLKDLAPPSSSG